MDIARSELCSFSENVSTHVHRSFVYSEKYNEGNGCRYIRSKENTVVKLSNTHFYFLIHRNRVSDHTLYVIVDAKYLHWMMLWCCVYPKADIFLSAFQFKCINTINNDFSWNLWTTENEWTLDRSAALSFHCWTEPFCFSSVFSVKIEYANGFRCL